MKNKWTKWKPSLKSWKINEKNEKHLENNEKKIDTHMDFKKNPRTVWEIREAFYYLFSPETRQQFRDGILTLFI